MPSNKTWLTPWDTLCKWQVGNKIFTGIKVKNSSQSYNGKKFLSFSICLEYTSCNPVKCYLFDKFCKRKLEEFQETVFKNKLVFLKNISAKYNRLLCTDKLYKACVIYLALTKGLVSK